MNLLAFLAGLAFLLAAAFHRSATGTVADVRPET